MQLRGARNWDNPRLLGKQPGERDLGWRCLLPFRDLASRSTQSLIRFPSLLRKAREDVAEVGTVEFVDQIEGDVAYVTLTSEMGEKLYGEYPAAELKTRGIHERRRFRCRTIAAGTRVEFDLEPIPDREVSEERERAIEEKLRELLGDDDAPQDGR